MTSAPVVRWISSPTYPSPAPRSSTRAGPGRWGEIHCHFPRARVRSLTCNNGSIYTPIQHAVHTDHPSHTATQYGGAPCVYSRYVPRAPKASAYQATMDLEADCSGAASGSNASTESRYHGCTVVAVTHRSVSTASQTVGRLQRNLLSATKSAAAPARKTPRSVGPSTLLTSSPVSRRPPSFSAK